MGPTMPSNVQGSRLITIKPFSKYAVKTVQKHSSSPLASSLIGYNGIGLTVSNIFGGYHTTHLVQIPMISAKSSAAQSTTTANKIWKWWYVYTRPPHFFSGLFLVASVNSTLERSTIGTWLLVVYQEEHRGASLLEWLPSEFITVLCPFHIFCFFWNHTLAYLANFLPPEEVQPYHSPHVPIPRHFC